jgi:hypothetical protein
MEGHVRVLAARELAFETGADSSIGRLTYVTETIDNYHPSLTYYIIMLL